MIFGFLGVILIGTILLALPISHKDGQSLSIIDSFFISTSAVCVTGLSSVNVSEVFSVFGKIVLALLIEIGGLGFVTVVMFVIILLGKKIDIKNRVIIKEALNQEKLSGVVKLVKKIFITTIIIQLIGACVNFIVFIQEYDFLDALGISIFHSISAFNNAGFDLFGSESIIKYTDNIIININTMALIILGGIGFIVIFDMLDKKKPSRYTIYTKIVLKTTFALLVIGTILIKLSSYELLTWHEALFTSVTTRTAGFATVDMSKLSSATLLLIMCLMFIGASPTSTGGGVKTTTIFIIINSIKSFIYGKKDIIVENRKISKNSLNKAHVLVIFALLFVIIITFLVALCESICGSDMTIEQIAFESVSAFGTVGLSMGITSKLSSVSKIILCIAMFFGRLGPITMMSALHNISTRDEDSHLKYVEENIIIG